MNKINYVLFFILALFLSSKIYALDYQATYCIEIVYLETTNMHPPTTLTTLVENKKNKVKLQVPVDCKKGKLLVPKSEDDAVKFLDIMLPINFKNGLIFARNPASIYLTSPYGASVVNDLHSYLFRPWKLYKNKNICYPNGNQKNDSDECFDVLIDRLVMQYKNRNGLNSFKETKG